MPRSLRDAKLDTREARLRLPVRAKPYWRLLEPGLHVGYRRLKGRPGSWCLRRYVGSQAYVVEGLGTVADDYGDADGVTVMSFKQAQRAVLASKPRVAAGALTVADALGAYLEDLAHRGKSTRDVRYRIDALILPALGAIAVEALSAEQIRAWHASLAKAPARRGRKDDDGEAPRRRRSSANRTLVVLRAALNLSYREGRMPSDLAWRRVKPFHNVDSARLRYLTVTEAQRLINACDPNFRCLVQAALQTGMRYGELGRLRVHDFNPDSATVAVHESKSGRPRHVHLTDEGAALFRRWCAGKAGGTLLFTRNGGEPWGRANQDLPMRLACQRARVEPRINFHGLRHTYASLAVMNGAPLLVVAKNLGHNSIEMVQAHYGHLSQDFVGAAIRAAAARFGIEPDDTVVPMPSTARP